MLPLCPMNNQYYNNTINVDRSPQRCMRFNRNNGYLLGNYQQTLFIRNTSNKTDENNPPSAPSDDYKESIFTKISRGEIPVETIYEDDKCIAFPDINPQAPTHVLIIPKKEISRISRVSDDDKDILGSLLIGAKRAADKLNLDDGYRLVINDGKIGGQTVYHLHVHLLSGRQMIWPPG